MKRGWVAICNSNRQACLAGYTVTRNAFGYYKAGGNIYSYRDNHFAGNSDSFGTLLMANTQ